MQGGGASVTLPADWVVKYAPVLKVTLKVLSLAVGACRTTGYPVPFPDLTKVIKFVDGATEALPSEVADLLDQTASAVPTRDTTPQAAVTPRPGVVQRLNELTGPAYAAITKFFRYEPASLSQASSWHSPPPFPWLTSHDQAFKGKFPSQLVLQMLAPDLSVRVDEALDSHHCLLTDDLPAESGCVRSSSWAATTR